MSEAVDHKALIDAMTEGMYVVDRQRTITFWNPAAERISGYTAEQSLGRWCGDGLLNHVDEAGEPLCGTRCPLSGVMLDGRPRAVHAYLHHGDGYIVPVTIAASALRDDDGRIVGAVETFREDAEHSEAVARLRDAEHRAATDSLTGIGNRRHLETCLRQRLADWTRYGRRFGALLIDLDHFKSVNSAYGHAGGDTVLRTVARSVAHSIRGNDTVGRFGGEEFMVLTEADGVEGLVALADRLRMVIAQSRHPGLGGLTVTASVGVSIVRSGDTPETLLRRADDALFAAKDAGRNATVVGPSSLVGDPPAARR